MWRGAKLIQVKKKDREIAILTPSREELRATTTMRIRRKDPGFDVDVTWSGRLGNKEFWSREYHGHCNFPLVSINRISNHLCGDHYGGGKIEITIDLSDVGSGHSDEELYSTIEIQPVLTNIIYPTDYRIRGTYAGRSERCEGILYETKSNTKKGLIDYDECKQNFKPESNGYQLTVSGTVITTTYKPIPIIFLPRMDLGRIRRER